MKKVFKLVRFEKIYKNNSTCWDCYRRSDDDWLGWYNVISVPFWNQWEDVSITPSELLEIAEFGKQFEVK